MILQPGAVPFCVMQAQICELRLDHMFFLELRSALPRLSMESIAYDFLQGSATRETISRKSGRSKYHRGAFVYALVHVLTTRDHFMVRNMSSSVYRPIAQAELNAVRALLYRYGVSCAQEKCCVQQAVFLEKIS